MNVKILSPEKTLFQGKASLIEVPGEKGRFQILVNHATIVSTLEKGRIRIVTEDNKEENFEIKSGVIEHHQNESIILVET
ncbi:MAG: F0F1 ATP synthase subunit epsilon [Bacteroidales bacterium]|nr:F0F1 ATP synthase subunit epsilon [Bacteroidales bacterium]